MDALRTFFGPGGKLASAHSGFEYRPGQEEMARTVARILQGGGAGMVEAGTGTGKTLAYLVPAVHCGRRVIVSTGTRNLQDQIFGKDLPFLRRQVGFDVSACMMKGRDNYLCRYRLGQFEREPLLHDVEELPWLTRIAEWARATESGDRAEIADLPDNVKLWRDVNARSETCTGSRCPEYEDCWLTLLKRDAQEAQIVVVNHHLFFADLAVRSAYGSVLPEYDTVIFDEAHLLEEIATLYFGVQVSSAQIEELAREIESLAARGGGPKKGGGGAAAVRLAAQEFFLPLRYVLRGEPGRANFAPPERGGPDLEAEWAVLSSALDELERQASSFEQAARSVEALPRRVEEIRSALQRVLDRRDPAHVYGIELRGRGSVLLSAAPIDVSDLLRERLFDRLHATVLTSASLAVQGSFGFFVERLGLEAADTRIVESSFDYGNQAVLYLPQSMPEPGHPKFIARAVEEITGLAEITSGRGFVLFTSYAHLQKVREALERLDRWPLIVQGEGSKAALVETFRDASRALLLGTTSFWHGVDVPGEALSLVIIDKLPFGVPTDPLVAARINRIRESGGNPFMEYQVPLAVLELKQGLGRLLRSTTDRGILAVLDPRLTTRRYGKVFVDSLPSYRVVRRHSDCKDFFSAASETS